jgi:hypothetical protein
LALLTVIYSLAAQSRVHISVEPENVPIERMIALTQVALCISPLVLLSPVKYTSDSFSRDSLINVCPCFFLKVVFNFISFTMQYSSCLGSKPNALAYLERSLWHAICQVATGGHAEIELGAFFEDFKDMKDHLPTQYAFTYWFKLGMKSIIL